jgi:hypothetical protein
MIYASVASRGERKKKEKFQFQFEPRRRIFRPRREKDDGYGLKGKSLIGNDIY